VLARQRAMQAYIPVEQVQHIRAKLTEELQALKLPEEELKRQSGQSRREWVRRDRMSLAIGYLQKAVDHLDTAFGRAPC
jgi:hypothetical protein